MCCLEDTDGVYWKFLYESNEWVIGGKKSESFKHNTSNRIGPYSRRTEQMIINDYQQYFICEDGLLVTRDDFFFRTVQIYVPPEVENLYWIDRKFILTETGDLFEHSGIIGNALVNVKFLKNDIIFVGLFFNNKYVRFYIIADKHGKVWVCKFKGGDTEFELTREDFYIKSNLTLCKDFKNANK